MKNLIYSAVVLLFFSTPAISEIYATSVHLKVPGTYVEAPYDDANQALGPPDERGDDPTPNWYSLGNGGTLIVKFDTPFTDGPGNDLTIYEIGRVGEACDVEISTDGDFWIKVGSTGRYTSGIDIYSFLKSNAPSGFSYVKLIDVYSDVYDTEKWAGADINAVGAIHPAIKPVVKIESIDIEKSTTPCLERLNHSCRLRNYTNNPARNLYFLIWLDSTRIWFGDVFDEKWGLGANTAFSVPGQVLIPMRPSGDYTLKIELLWILDLSDAKDYQILDTASLPLEISECPEIGGLVHTLIMSVLDK